MQGLLLIASSAAGDLLSVQQLLRAGADPNASDSGAWTPLHLAAAGGHVDVLRLLLSQGADPTARNERGDTALQVAAMLRQVAAANVLIEWARGSLPPRVDSGGRTPGDCAQLGARPGTSGLLLEPGGG